MAKPNTRFGLNNMAAYYNEIDPAAAQWLRNLIAKGLIAAGDVDERSIVDVKADDLKGYTQHHFFAGIGGWSLALRMAGWPDDKPVTTGSCPCQPFSTAGKQKGKNDERHLWPAWFKLIREYKPSVIYGEQVAASLTHGWLDEVFDDLEREGYTCGAAIVPACGVGKPHKRDRLWFVGYSKLPRPHGGSIAGSTRKSEKEGRVQQLERPDTSFDVADTNSAGLQGHRRHEPEYDAQGRQEQDGYAGEADIQWVECPDGKPRPVKSTVRLLVNGLSGRVAIVLPSGETQEYNRSIALKGLGNAIVPSVAAKFVEASGL
jgi:DNA (cytosine-5)-methyltransferase 1